MALKLGKCALCKEEPGYWVPVRKKQVSICAVCLKDISELIKKPAKPRKGQKQRKLHLFRKALLNNVAKRGSVYASSLGWRFGLSRVEVSREVQKMAKVRKWRITRTPSNHIVVSAGVEGDADQEHRATTTYPE